MTDDQADQALGSGDNILHGYIVSQSNISLVQPTITGSFPPGNEWSLVPGELYYALNPAAFGQAGEATKIQIFEKLYYQPCSKCSRLWHLCKCK